MDLFRAIGTFYFKTFDSLFFLNNFVLFFMNSLCTTEFRNYASALGRNPNIKIFDRKHTNEHKILKTVPNTKEGKGFEKQISRDDSPPS